MPRKYPFSLKDNIVVQELDGEILIYDLRTHRAFCLNKTSAAVWQLCDGKSSLTAIAAALTEKLDQPANEEIVWLAVDDLKKKNLVSGKFSEQHKFNGLSRREIIKKAGMTTLVSLPLISTLVVPQEVMAQSCVIVIDGCSCRAFSAGGPPVGFACTGANLIRMCTSPACRCIQKLTPGNANDDCRP